MAMKVSHLYDFNNKSTESKSGCRQTGDLHVNKMNAFIKV